MAETAPEVRTLGNIVKDIPKEKQEEIATEVCEQYDIDLESRSEWEEMRDEWYKLWACITGDKTTPWEGASNVCVPLLASACSQFHGRSYQSIFAPPGIVRAVPVSENDIKRAKNVENFMNWQTLYEMDTYEEVFDKLLQLLPLNGTAFKKCYYSKALDMPITENIEATDLVLPYSTKSLPEARRMAHRIWLHYDELQERNEEGLYENFDKVKEMPEAEDETGLGATADKAVGQEASKKEEKPHLILECHKRVDIGNGRIPYVFTVDYDSQTLLRGSERWFGKDKKELNYFIDYHFIPNPKGFYSFGFGHFLKPMIEMTNTIFNQIFDAGSLSNMPFGFYGRRAGIKAKNISLGPPGKMTPVADASQIFFPRMQHVGQELFMFLGQTQQYIEQFTSTSDYIQGRESKGTKTPTAHGTLAIIEQGLVTFAVMTKRIFRSLRKELRLILNLNQLFLPDEKEYRIVGDLDKIAFSDIKRADFDTVQDVMPTGDPSYANKMTRRQEAQELYQMMMSNPLIIGNPDMQIPPNIKSIHALTSDLLDAYDKKNKSQLLPDLPEEKVSPEYENAMMMQGDYPEPKPGENHQEHFMVHMAFVQSGAYANLPPDYKKMVQTHVKATQAVAMMEAQQMRQLGSQVGPPQGGQGPPQQGPPPGPPQQGGIQ